VFWLTGTPLSQYLDFFEVHSEYEEASTVLEVGVGRATAIKQMSLDKKEIYAIDISDTALNKVSALTKIYNVGEIEKLPSNSIDLAFSFLVAQHINDEMFTHHLTHILPALKKDGIFCLHYAGELDGNKNDQGQAAQERGGIVRTSSLIQELVEDSGGFIIKDTVRQAGLVPYEANPEKSYEYSWRAAIVRRNNANPQ